MRQCTLRAKCVNDDVIAVGARGRQLRYRRALAIK
jgi:hypothetical protein